MAKRTRTRERVTRHAATVPAAEAAEAAAVPIIVVPAGATLDVIVDVGPMVVPYTITVYDGRTVIKSLVDRSEPVAVKPGDFILAWAFAHAVKEWTHTVAYSIDDGPVQILEKRSERKRIPITASGSPSSGPERDRRELSPCRRRPSRGVRRSGVRAGGHRAARVPLGNRCGRGRTACGVMDEIPRGGGA